MTAPAAARRHLDLPRPDHVGRRRRPRLARPRRRRAPVHARAVGRRAPASATSGPRATSQGWAGRQPGGLRDPHPRRRSSSAWRGSCELDRDAREGEIGYVVGRGGARPRRRDARRSALLTRWGFDELELERIELLIDVGERRLRARRRALRLHARRAPALRAREGGPARRTRASGRACAPTDACGREVAESVAVPSQTRARFRR